MKVLLSHLITVQITYIHARLYDLHARLYTYNDFSMFTELSISLRWSKRPRRRATHYDLGPGGQFSHSRHFLAHDILISWNFNEILYVALEIICRVLRWCPTSEILGPRHLLKTSDLICRLTDLQQNRQLNHRSLGLSELSILGMPALNTPHWIVLIHVSDNGLIE